MKMGELALNMKRISDLRERFTERHDLLSGMFFSLTISALFEVAVDAKCRRKLKFTYC